MSLWLWTTPSRCKLHIKRTSYGQSEALAAAPVPAPTCDRILNEAQHRARVFVDVEADGVVFLRDPDDEVGVPVH